MAIFAKRLTYKGATYTLYEVYSSRSKAIAEAEYLETTQHADVVVQPRGSSFGVYAFVRRRPIRNPKKRIKKNPALMVIGNPQPSHTWKFSSWDILQDTLQGLTPEQQKAATTSETPTGFRLSIPSHLFRKVISGRYSSGKMKPKKNPKGDLMSDSVHEVRYTHRQDGAPYKHTFKAGVRMVANADGTITLYHPTKRIHEEFPE